MIEKIKLKDFVSEDCTRSQNFNYGDVEGTADIVGWQVILFKDSNNISSVSALSLCEFEGNSDLKKIANKILNSINFPIRIDDEVKKVKKVYGNELVLDNTLEDEIGHYYLIEGNLVRFGVNGKNKICSIEIINNKLIINERLNCVNI